MCCFYDDTCSKTTTPSTVPDVRWGRKENSSRVGSLNGYKFQTLELPNGMCADMYGPLSHRHCDLDLLVGSDLNNRLRDVQNGDAVQYVA